MAKSMEEEIDGLDLEGNFTGEKETVEETPKGTEEKEPEKQKEPVDGGDAGKEPPEGGASETPPKKEERRR